MKFAPQPKSGELDAPIPLTVEIDNAKGQPDTSATSDAVLSLNTVSGGAGAVLSGTTIVPFVGGKAVFSAMAGPMINVSGTYTFTVTEEDYTLGVLGPTNTTTAVASAQFTVAALQIAFAQQPGKSFDPLTPIPLKLKLVDSNGSPAKPPAASQVVLTLNPVSGGSGATLGGTTTGMFSGGVATFTRTAAPDVVGAGMFTITATQIGVADPAAPATSNPFTVTGYILKLLNDIEPFTATNPDIDTGAYYSPFNEPKLFGVFDAQDRPVTSIANLPALDITSQAVTGQGTLTGGVLPAVGTFRTAYLSGTQAQTMNSTLGTTQANYPAEFTFTAVGTYAVTLSPSQSSGSTAVASLIQPLTIQCTAANPDLGPGFSNKRVTANEATTGHVSLGQKATLKSSLGSAEIFEDLTPVTSAGVALTLVSSSSQGTITGTTAALFTMSTGPNALPLAEANISIAFSTAGLYVLMATEMISPNGLPFDPANATAVATTAPITFTFRVQPDKLVITQQPPVQVSVGEAFSITASLEDNAGNVASDQSPSDSDALVAVLTATSATNPNPVSESVPVEFVSGVAMIEGLTFSATGIYRLHIAVSSEVLPSGFLSPPDLTAKSDLIRVVP